MVEYEQYEGASRYVTLFDVIYTLLKLKKPRERCKYETRAKISAFVERDYIRLGKEYDMDGILEYVDMIDQHQCFDEYFYRK